MSDLRAEYHQSFCASTHAFDCEASIASCGPRGPLRRLSSRSGREPTRRDQLQGGSALCRAGLGHRGAAVHWGESRPTRTSTLRRRLSTRTHRTLHVARPRLADRGHRLDAARLVSLHGEGRRQNSTRWRGRQGSRRLDGRISRTRLVDVPGALLRGAQSVSPSRGQQSSRAHSPRRRRSRRDAVRGVGQPVDRGGPMER